jgi:hypothetical protein
MTAAGIILGTAGYMPPEQSGLASAIVDLTMGVISGVLANTRDTRKDGKLSNINTIIDESR